jgi:phage shock protein PspC (stress-responsive transcriptional regulator)
MDTAPTTTTQGESDREAEPASSPSSSSHPPDEHLQRGGDGRMLAGVAIGLAEYFDIDPTLVRIGFVALTLLGGLAVPLYLAGWLLIPAEGADASVAEDLLARERAR